MTIGLALDSVVVIKHPEPKQQRGERMYLVDNLRLESITQGRSQWLGAAGHILPIVKNTKN